jgi:hypothetical protein
MFVIRPFAHVGTNCGEDGLGDGGADPGDGDQISPRKTEERRPGGANWGVLAVCMRFAWRRGGTRRWGRLRGGFAARCHDGEGACDLRVTCAELRGRDIKQGSGVLQDKERLLMPGAGEGAGDLVAVLLATRMAPGGQRARVAFACDNSADEALSRGAHDITERLREVHIPLPEGLWQRQDVGGTVRKQLRPLASEGAQRHKLCLGTKGRFSHAIAMQSVPPRAVPHIAFASWDVRDRLGADQTALHATGFEGLKQGDPIHAGGCHGDGLDVAVEKPVRHGVEISRGGAKGAYPLLVVAHRHARHTLIRAHIDPSGVGMDLPHARERTGVALGRSATVTCAQFTPGEGSFWDHARSPQPESLRIGVNATRVGHRRDREPCGSAG